LKENKGETMPKIVEAEDLAREVLQGPNKEAHVTTEGILKGFQEINQTPEMKEFYDSVIPSAKDATS
jgi:hypothetical protein